MINGVLFGDKHSYTDWGLVLQERPVISTPSVKTNYISIPGGNGSIDLTEILSDDVKYDNREITCKFHVLNDRNNWSDIYTMLQEHLHGQAMQIVLDEDNLYYYKGRVSVDEWMSSKTTSTITVKAIVEPYKYERFSSLEFEKWAENMIVNENARNYRDISILNTRTFEIVGTRMHVIPTFEVTGTSMQVYFNNNSFTLPVGKSRVMNIVIKEGINVLEFKGEGTVSIDYRGGRL